MMFKKKYTISPREQEIIDLQQKEGLTKVEIAQKLGLEIGSVTSAISGARRYYKTIGKELPIPFQKPHHPPKPLQQGALRMGDWNEGDQIEGILGSLRAYGSVVKICCIGDQSFYLNKPLMRTLGKFKQGEKVRMTCIGYLHWTTDNGEERKCKHFKVEKV